MDDQTPGINQRELRDFWHPPFRRTSIESAVKWCYAELGYTAEKFVDSLSTLGFPAQHMVAGRTLHRVIKHGVTPDTRPRTLSCFLVALDAILSTNERPEDAQWRIHRSSVADEIRHFRDQFASGFGLSLPGVSQNDARFVGPADVSIPQLIGLLRAYLLVDPKDLIDIARYFLPNFDPSQISEVRVKGHYDCYRFHSKPGHVVKTFMVIKSPTTSVPVCLFSNFFRGPSKSSRRTDGIIIPTATTIYFVGTMQTSKALKLMAMDRHSMPQGRIHGLMISFDDDEALITSRFVMVPSKATDDVEANAGIHTMKKLRREILPFVDDLRNRINFNLEKDLRFDGDPLTQVTMVEKVSRALHKKGKPRLVDVGRREFNPATHREYTFNSALRSWRTEGD